VIHDELTLSPFQRAIVGGRGTVLLRRDEHHAQRCADAIRRREHPRWSSQRIDFRVAAA
jgi:hypothetical protein